MSAGTWAELIFTGMLAADFVAGATATSDYLTKGTYNPVGQKIMWIGQGHNERQDWCAYDEATNTFDILSPPPWGSGFVDGFIGHGYHHNAVDPNTGDFYYRMTNSATVRRFIQASQTWDTIAAAQTSGNAIAGALTWHPGIGASGGLVAFHGEYLQRWDRSTNSWDTVSSSIALPQNHTIAHYNPADQLVYFGGGNGDSNALYSVGASGAHSALTDCPISMGIPFSVSECCPVSGDLLVIESNASAQVFNGSTWAALDMTGAPTFSISSGSGTLAVQIPAYGVIAYVFCDAEEIWLYKHV